jgi:hypothetical protein
MPYQVLLSPGVEIEHSVAEYPSFVVFWTWDFADLREALQQNAFPITTAQA